MHSVPSTEKKEGGADGSSLLAPKKRRAFHIKLIRPAPPYGEEVFHSTARQSRKGGGGSIPTVCFQKMEVLPKGGSGRICRKKRLRANLSPRVGYIYLCFGEKKERRNGGASPSAASLERRELTVKRESFANAGGPSGKNAVPICTREGVGERTYLSAPPGRKHGGKGKRFSPLPGRIVDFF